MPYRVDGRDVLLSLRVTPNAGLDRIEGIEQRDDGSAVVRVRVKAVPDKGKANKAVAALVAKSLGVSKSSVSLVAGETSRLKLVRIAGDAEALIRRIEALRQS